LQEVIARKGLLEFLPLGLRRIVPLKVQQAVQMGNDRIECTVLIIRGTTKLQAEGSLRYHPLLDLLHQAGFADTGLSA
jgi:hypothetical protein